MKRNRRRGCTLVLGSVVLVVTLCGAGTASADPPPPTVSTISIPASGYPLPAHPVITVTGSGFGAKPAGGVSPSQLTNCGSGTGLDFPNSQLWLLDASRSGGLSGAFEEGELFTPTTGNCGGIVLKLWTATKVVFTLGSRYAADGHSLEPGDVVCVDVKSVPACTMLPPTS